MFKKKPIEGRKTKDLKIDETKLSQKELEESGFKIRKGLLIFIIILIIVIIVLSIIVVRIKTN